MATLYTQQNKNVQKTWFLMVVCLVAFFLSAGFASAQDARSYSYDAIDYDIRINENSTIDVKEYERFNFIGEYHQGWRNIPKKGIDALTDISVIDISTGKALEYSSKRLEKTDPKSWGKFTTFFQNSEYVIEWYYNARNTKHSWELDYKLHGAVSFYDNHDEFYWNLFTKYSAPIAIVKADVRLPQKIDQKLLRSSLYLSDRDGTNEGTRSYFYPINDIRAFGFETKNILPNTAMTIAPGWPKELVSKSGYWLDFIFIYWTYVVGVFLVVAALLYAIIRWYRLERLPFISRTIVPEYEPPRSLTPAVMGVILKESVSVQTWPATIIDLAVRGFVRIEEEGGIPVISVKNTLFTIFIAVFMIISLMIGLQFPLVGSVFFVIFASFLSLIWLASREKHYKIVRINDGQIGRTVNSYENDLMSALFGETNVFSTQEMRKSENNTRAQLLTIAMIGISGSLIEETAKITGGYAHGFKWENRRGYLIMLFPLTFALFLLLDSILGITNFSQVGENIIVPIILFAVALVIFVGSFMEARLNEDGNELKRQIAGFKLYLMTAERYRLQNLTPDLFQKYLPYAIIFGVEKKWASAFRSIDVPQPSWYAGASVSGAVSVGGFSAASFTSSFSSSFSTSFSSSGGGGASGGGGGAGGGGGGGGGGAS